MGGNEQYVMDVVLKKAYSNGWLGNFEGGYGLPSDKYLGKSFVLGYNDKVRVSAFANLNNIMDTQVYLPLGEQINKEQNEGRLDVKMGGLGYFYKQEKHKLQGNMKLLLKFYIPTSGTIRLGDNDLQTYSAKSIRKASGIVMQDNYLFSDTIRQNIILGEDADETRLQETINVACLKDVFRSHPLGIDTKVGAEGIGVSGGEKQRIMIVRAVYKRPMYLMMDEATSSLDAENEANITRNIAACFKGRTRVVIAHRLSTVKHADNIVVLRQGRVVEQGTHDDLVKLHGYYYELIHNQLEIPTV